MEPAAPRSILVIQLRRLGDVVLTTPALEALKARWPGARLDFLVEAPGAEAVAGNPAVDEVLVYDARGPLGALSWALKVRARRYDWVVDFLANPRTALITALSGAKVKAGPGHVSRRWAYNARMAQSQDTCYAALEKVRWLAALGVKPEHAPALPRLFLAPGPRRPDDAVGFFPASRKETRAWPAESWMRLGRLLRERHGVGVRVFWGPGERELAAAVARGCGGELAPETRGVKDLAAALAACRLVVSNCAGPKHVAVGMGVPTVTVHGSSDPAAWTPAHPEHKAVRLHELHCIGCRLNDCPYGLECLRQLPAERVLAACGELLELPGSRRPESIRS